jgi:L-tyrosine peroxygenase
VKAAAESPDVLSSEDGPLLQPGPLFLPHTGDEYDESSHIAPLSEFTMQRQEDAGYDLLGGPQVAAERLFWYRWIEGHQVSFVLWRTMGDVLGRQPDGMPSQRELDVLTTCVDGYSAMLLYSATVPREHYHACTRVRMALQHPAFSGAWAPDYRPIHRLFRGRLPWQDDPSCDALNDAVTLNRETHDHIADHLVPDGRSLLQKSAGGPGAVSREKEDLYDNFFLTIRRSVSHAEVVEQLDSRIAELTEDLGHNGLYPNVDGAHFPVLIGSSSDAMASLATDVLTILRRAAVLIAAMARPLEEARR